MPTLDAWAVTLRCYHYDDVAAAVRELAEADDWPSLAKLVARTLDIREARAQAQTELDRREAWKRAAERGLEAGPRPEPVIPDEYKAFRDRLLGRIGEDPDRPTMSWRRQLQRLEAAYCCPLHNRHCEPPSELCCERCTEVRHPEHPQGVPCVLGVTAK